MSGSFLGCGTSEGLLYTYRHFPMLVLHEVIAHFLAFPSCCGVKVSSVWPPGAEVGGLI
jgi:hypothetical protein